MISQELRDELLAMRDEDNRVQQELIDSGELGAVEYHPKMKAVHEKNNYRIKGIIDQYGWPKVSDVGPEASTATWLLVQHAILDTDFMESCLNKLESAIQAKEAEPWHFAYLKDRVLTMADKPQIYGTQHDIDESGIAFPLPIENPDIVDSLRESVGLGSLSEATDKIQERHNLTVKNRNSNDQQ